MLEEELKAMNPDMGAIEAYARKDAEYTARVADLEAATAERDQVCATCDSAVEDHLVSSLAGLFPALSLADWADREPGLSADECSRAECRQSGCEVTQRYSDWLSRIYADIRGQGSRLL